VNGTTNARESCRSTVARQAHDGYVIEYISRTIERPNPGFEDDPEYLQELVSVRGLYESFESVGGR
jgi:5-methylcytosine-specific restriction protein A